MNRRKGTRNNTETVEAPVVTPVIKREKLSDSDITKVKEAKSKAVYLAMLAEKAYSQAVNAELETKNLVLTIFNTYGLDMVKDKVLDDGTIVRGGLTEVVKEDANG